MRGQRLLNGILAQLLGAGLTFRQASLAILLSFATAALVLGVLSPVAFFFFLHAPPLQSTDAGSGHSFTMVMHVGVIALAGFVGNLRLLRLIERMSASREIAVRVLVSWLAGNLLLGSQLAYVLRPFIGNPRFPVQFLRDDPLRGNFYETLWRAFADLFL